MEIRTMFIPSDKSVSVPARRHSVLEGKSQVTAELASEHSLQVYVNDRLVYVVVCTPANLVELVVGRLFTEGVISGIDQVESLFLCDKGTQAKVYLAPGIDAPSPILQEQVPSCCTGNKVYATPKGQGSIKQIEPISWEPEWVYELARSFAVDTPLHSQTQGVHSCSLSVGGEILFVHEDLGRHNAFDKVVGHALLKGVDVSGALVFSSGRIPVDMVLKALRSGIPVLVSKAVPTDVTVELAQEHGLTLICQAYPDSFVVYTA